MPPARPTKLTGSRPSLAIFTSSIIWPMLISTTSRCRAVSGSAWKGQSGKGNSVTGRISPARMPSSASSSMALRTIRLVVPYATSTISAPSRLKVSKRGSSRRITRYFSNSRRLCRSSSSGFRNRELMTFGARCPAVPVVAQVFGGRSRCGGSWNSTGSIICPSIPSPTIMTGLR